MSEITKSNCCYALSRGLDTPTAYTVKQEAVIKELDTGAAPNMDNLRSSRTFSSDLLNITGESVNAPPRTRPLRGLENVPVESTSAQLWDEDSEEAKVIFDLGIEDSDAEEEQEIFNSIPGYDDEWIEDETAIDAMDSSRGRDITKQIMSSSSSSTESDSDTSSSPGDDPSMGSEFDDSDLGSDASEDNDPVLRCGAIHKERHAYDVGGDDLYTVVTDCREYHSTIEAAGYDTAPELIDMSGTERQDLQQASDDEDLNHHTTFPSIQPVRRSARLKVIAKRPRQETPEDMVSSPPPAAKRRCVQAARGARSCAATTRRQKGKAKALTQLQGNDSDIETEPSGKSLSRKRMRVSHPALQRPEAGRSGRIPQTFLESCIVSDHATITCGIDYCGKTLVVKKPREARKHIKSHYTTEHLAATQTECLWGGCGQTVTMGKNADGLMRHYNEAHLELRYGCPGECKDRRGKRRVWARVDELTRHESNDPCEYLLKHPIPRSK